jgi:phage gpG-like protein
MGGTFEATLDVTALGKILKRLGAKPADLTDVMAVVSEQLVSAVNDEFESGGRGRWPPHAKSTIKKRRGDAPHQLLVDTGALAGSIRGESGPDFALATTDKFYAVFHVSDAPRTIIPLRNFFDVPDDVYEDAAITILAAIAE